MIFCGHCGLQLPPGSTRCPRCGASVEPGEVATSGDLHMDDATIAARAFAAQNQRPPQTPQNQQPLVLRGNDYGTQDANGATSRVEQISNNTQMPPTQQVRGNTYGTYPPQGISNTPLHSNSGYPLQNTGSSYPPQVPYPTYQPAPPSYTDVPPQMGMSYQQYPVQYSGQYPPQHQPTHTKGRTTGLILVFIGLLLILSAAILLAMQQGLIGSKRANGGSSGGAALAITAIQHTQHTIQHTYNYTNHLYIHPYVDTSYNPYTQQQIMHYNQTTLQGGTMKFIVSVNTRPFLKNQ